jgi:hypothetical protein
MAMLNRLSFDRLKTERRRSLVWHALVLAYVCVAAAPTVIDALEKAATRFHGAL